VVRRNVNRHWIGAFAYFGLAAVVISSLLDGTLRGFVLATLVAILSLALADSVAGREIRVRLQAQLDDVDRHVASSRIVEGTIHNVRNDLAVGIAQLEEHELANSSSERKASIEAARSALGSAVDTLNQLQAGVSPVVSWASEPLRLSVIAADVTTLCEGRAAAKRVTLAFAPPRYEVFVRGDPVLLRQVVMNLVLNAIEAVATGGAVRVELGMRASGAALSVIDNGPGVPDKYRDRLFEPHFTTKPAGTGIGLFSSFGIVQAHGGELLYEGNRKGAVFTMVLPPVGR
jgi:signal transduction histidine kinase